MHRLPHHQHVCVLGHSVMSNSFKTPWTVALQAPLSTEFSRQEYWSELLFPSPGDLPDPGIKPVSPVAPALADRIFTTEPRGKLHYEHPPPAGTFVTTDEPTLTHPSHPKCMLHITVLPWWCTFCAFGQMYNDMYPPLWSHLEYFHCPKTPLCSACPSLTPLQPLATTDLFTLTIGFPFPECHRLGIFQYTAFSDWLLFLCNLHWSFFCIFSWLHSLKALNHIPSSGCTRVYLFIYLLKDILMVTKFWQLRISCYTDFMVV